MLRIPVWAVLPIVYFGSWGVFHNVEWLWDKILAAHRWLIGDARREISDEDEAWAERMRADRARHPASEGPPPEGDGPSNYLELPKERDWRDIKYG